MRRIIFRAAFVAIGSAFASLAFVAAVLPLFGGGIDGTAAFMSVVCPLAIAFPASLHHLLQNARLADANAALTRAHAELAALNQRLRDKASRDTMTGMFNREAFFARVEEERSAGECGGLLIIDADHFKRINDRWGHQTGDAALMAIASAIRDGARPECVLGRIGGEEFAAYLPGASPSQTRALAERIRASVASIRFRPAPETELGLTVSIGAALCERDATVSQVMREADSRLYEAKRLGRDRVVSAEIAHRAAA